MFHIIIFVLHISLTNQTRLLSFFSMTRLQNLLQMQNLVSLAPDVTEGLKKKDIQILFY